MRTLKRILGVLLIFFFGVFIGAAVTGAGVTQKVREMVLGGPEAVIDVVVKRLDHELKLDPEQKRKLQSIVDDARIKLRQSRAKIQPEVDSALHEAEERTRAILYPEQLKKFDNMLGKGSGKWNPTEAGKTTPAPGPPTPTPATPSPAPPEDAK